MIMQKILIQFILLDFIFFCKVKFVLLIKLESYLAYLKMLIYLMKFIESYNFLMYKKIKNYRKFRILHHLFSNPLLFNKSIKINFISTIL